MSIRKRITKSDRTSKGSSSSRNTRNNRNSRSSRNNRSSSRIGISIKGNSRTKYYVMNVEIQNNPIKEKYIEVYITLPHFYYIGAPKSHNILTDHTDVYGVL